MGALHRHDPWVAAQRIGELSMTHVESIDAHRAAAQKDIREATGRGADIEAHAAADVDPELVERGVELLAAARNVRRGRREVQDRIGGQKLTGFVVTPRRVALPHPHLAGKDQAHRRVAIRGQTPGDQQVVESRTFRSNARHCS